MVRLDTRPTRELFARLRAALLAVAVSLLIAACQGEAQDLTGTDEPVGAPILDDLTVPVELAIAPSVLGPRGSFATARGVSRDESAEIQLYVMGGSLKIWSPEAGVLFLSQLEIELADFLVPVDVLPPNGAYLTGVSARLERPVTVRPLDDGRTARVVAELDLEVSWALAVSEDQAYPLSRMLLRDVPFSLEISRNALGEPIARLVGFRDGTFWSWTDRFSLADLTIDLHTAGGDMADDGDAAE